MDIKNTGEFAKYCADRAGDPELVNDVNFADQWAKMAEALNKQYGGHGGTVADFCYDALKHVRGASPGSPQVTESRLRNSAHILSRFWARGEAFDEWFNSQVIVVQSDETTS